MSTQAALDVAWGDPDAWIRDGLHWLHHPLVRAEINRRISGDVAVDALHWFFRTVRQDRALPLPRVLLPGCGMSGLESRICQLGWAHEAIGVDFSPKVIQAARSRFGGVAGVRHVVADMDALPVGEAPFERASFDAVLCSGSLHHSCDVDGLFESLHALLKPEGWLFADEYVGPDRFQMPPAQVRQLRLAAELLPDTLRTTGKGLVRANYASPVPADIIAADPTEAAQSSRILPAMRSRFEIVALRPYGGGLLHPLLGAITQNFMDDAGTQVMRLLIEAEAELDRLGRLHHDFACAIARPKAN